MQPPTLPLKLLLSIILGGIIGLEREPAFEKDTPLEKEVSGHLGGIRTYALISLLGAVAGLLHLYGQESLYLLIAISFFILIFIYYAVGGWMVKSMGLTTELGAIFSFLIGFFITSDIFSTQLIIALSIVLSLILSIKQKSKSFILGIRRTEVEAFIGFAIIALVILPFLPNQAFHITDIPTIRTLLEGYNVNLDFFYKLEIVNPFKLWFIVALITGIDVFGYVLGKITGDKKGLLLASSVGGFISSTSTTQSLAQQSKNSQHINELVSAAVFANMTSFLQVFVLVAPLNSQWLITITPILLAIVVPALIIGIVLHLSEKEPDQIDSLAQEKSQTEKKQVFSLRPAIKFAILLMVIRAATKSALILFGQSGFLFSSIIASFSGIDAIVINLAELAGNTITVKAALFTLLCVNATNLLSKAGYAFFQAKREFALKFLVSILIVIGFSFIGYYFLV